jgi:hypothetical protein
MTEAARGGPVQPPGSSGADRMRRHRDRRRKGLIYLGIELRVTEIDRLVALGYLKPADRDDAGEIVLALYWFLDTTLR